VWEKWIKEGLKMNASRHPPLIMICHWINAFSILIMVGSGLKIYNASPIFGAKLPAWLTLGGWLGGAIQWHFAAMWLFVVNALVYLAFNVLSGRLRARFMPVRFAEFTRDLLDLVRFRLSHAHLDVYNTLQKVAYLSVIVSATVIICSGLAVWKPVQFPILRALMGDFDNSRVVHFFAMLYLVLFTLAHLTMVALVPRTLLNMLPFGSAQSARSNETKEENQHESK
jgi:thiosulfate reductase cytochrome b subunit